MSRRHRWKAQGVLFVAGEWSHCGIDTFTMLKVGSAWRIASLAYLRHPDGPPGG